ncbi:MAG: hypothetical protein A2542_01180 [Parcubacteria group bacterium RIFOXYD2_FULL_52_8]|nr:MAG: hypothetical protein A2542_01180 [Parcubacteria group bacterium RIFOXYD2_FULL_52_8]
MKKYDIVIANLNPVRGAVKSGIRPCLVVQNNRSNESLMQTVVVIPLTTVSRGTYFAMPITKSKRNGLKESCSLELAQVRAVDRSQIGKTIGNLDESFRTELRQKLVHLFDINDEF